MTTHLKKTFFSALLLLLVTGTASANVELPWLLSDGAVLQRDEPIPVWGTAPANSLVIVEFAGEEQHIHSDEQGKWRTTFKAREAGGPFWLTVSSGNHSKTVGNILIGDVWVCSGQSNMEWVLRNTIGAKEEINSTDNRQIRHFKIPRSWAPTPSDSLAGGQWLPATSDNLGEFTGIGWYFAKRINAETGVPIGLINSTWGGSRIEPWMSPEALGKTPEAATKHINELTEEGRANTASLKKSLQRWPGAVVTEVKGADADWSEADVNEKDWMTIRAPELWEQDGLQGVDGVIWYRKSFKLSETEASGDLTLGLARIDDNDITWVNGHKVGETNAYDAVRTYKVPAKFLRAGKNVVAVRVEDTGGGGGIYSNKDLLYVQTAGGEKRSLAGDWKIKADKVAVSMLENVNHVDTALYNKMLYPLFRVPVKGVLWYQGESNADKAREAEDYRQQFQAMITDWRARWHKPDLPFYWVQLASFDSHNDTEEASPWAILRESQSAALALPNTGQAITLDVGNPKDIHPRDKKTVGNRLARIALHQVYGQREIDFRGPVFDSAQIKGNKLIVRFNDKGNLKTEDKGKTVKGFEIAGADGKFKPVDGKIKKTSVVLSLSGIKNPTMFRYAWRDAPEEANLADSEGLPAEPFRAEL